MVPGRAMYTQPGVTWYSQVQPQTPRCSQNAARYSHVAASTARYNQCAAPVTDTAIVISVGQPLLTADVVFFKIQRNYKST